METPLYKAIMKGEKEEVDSLLAGGAQVDELCGGKSPLLVAASIGNTEIVKKLIESGANVNRVHPSISWPTALFASIQKNHFDTVKILLEKGAEVNIEMKDKQTPIHFAVRNDIAQITKRKYNILHTALSTRGCKPEVVKYLLTKKEINKNLICEGGRTPLACAIMTQNAEAVRILLEDSEIKIREGEKGEDGLNLAAKHADPDVAKAFVEFKDKLNLDKDVLLTLAIRAGDKELINQLIDGGVDVNGDYKEIPFVYTAVEQVDMLEVLFEKGAKIDTTFDEQTLLDVAVEKNYLDVIKFLVKSGAGLNGTNECGLSPMFYVSTPEVIDLLVELGADINKTDDEGDTPLHEAVKEQDIETIETLIKHKANINSANDEGEYPLDLAAQEENWEAVNLLISKGANKTKEYNAIKEILDKDQPDSLRLLFKHKLLSVTASLKGWYAIHFAARNGSINCCKVLVDEYNSKIDIPKPSSPLHLACKADSMEVVEFLIERGADINIRREDGITPIFLAVLENNVPMVEYLICKGAKLDIAHNEGNTVLHTACLEANLEMVNLLLDHMAYVHSTNKRGDTPLLSLCQASEPAYDDPQHLAVAKILLDKGANMNDSQRSGSSAIMLASEAGLTEVVKELISRGGDVNTKTKVTKEFPGNVTALHLAAQNGHLAITKLLVENGAQVNVQDTRDISPLLAAQLNKHKEIEKFLRSQGAKEPHIRFG